MHSNLILHTDSGRSLTSGTHTTSSERRSLRRRQTRNVGVVPLSACRSIRDSHTCLHKTSLNGLVRRVFYRNQSKTSFSERLRTPTVEQWYTTCAVPPRNVQECARGTSRLCYRSPQRAYCVRHRRYDDGTGNLRGGRERSGGWTGEGNREVRCAPSVWVGAVNRFPPHVAFERIGVGAVLTRGLGSAWDCRGVLLPDGCVPPPRGAVSPERRFVVAADVAKVLSRANSMRVG